MAARTAIQPYNLNALAITGGVFTSVASLAGTTTPGMPASTTPVTNSNNWAVAVTITGGTLTFVFVNSVQVGTTAGTYWVPAGGTISITYSVAPAWTWVPSGLDAAGAGGTNYAAIWNGAATGVQFVCNGLTWLWYYNGATACTASMLIGQKVGGDVFPFATDQAVLTTNGTGWLGPFSPQKYTQQDGAQFSGAPGGIISGPPTGVGLACVDFSAVGTLVVRLMQLIPVVP